MKKDKKKKRLITGIILGGVALFLLAMVVSYLNDQLSRDYTEVQATVQSIVTDQRFTGVIESRNREDIVSSQALEIDKIYVAEGDPVENESLLLDTSYGAQYESTIIGEVSKIYFKEGDQVPAGAKMMDIVDFNNLQVAIKVDEYEIANIQVGLDVRILIDSINQEAAGVVRDISREAVNQDGLSYFTAIVDFQRDGEIRVGMNAEIIIEKERADQSLTLPMEALQFDAENKPWVLVKEESGETSERSLDLGINDGVNIEVRAGISDSEIVLVPQAMSEGFPMGPPEGVGGNR